MEIFKLGSKNARCL